MLRIVWIILAVMVLVWVGTSFIMWEPLTLEMIGEWRPISRFLGLAIVVWLIFMLSIW